MLIRHRREWVCEAAESVEKHVRQEVKVEARVEVQRAPYRESELYSNFVFKYTCS